MTTAVAEAPTKTVEPTTTVTFTVTYADIYLGVQTFGVRCPVALALRRTLGKPLTVGYTNVYLDGEDDWVLDRNAQEFIRDFDCGRFVRSGTFTITRESTN